MNDDSENPRPFPRDPDRLLREVDASIRIREIDEAQRLREHLTVQWWESALVVLLFVSGIGVIVTVANLVPQSPPLLHYFILGWSALWVLTLISCVEFLLRKFRALRRMTEILAREVHLLREELHDIRKGTGTAAPASASAERGGAEAPHKA